MKQEYNTLNNDGQNALKTAITSSLRSISPSYESAHSWYNSQRPVLRHTSVRSRFYIPVFGSAFAAACAFVMIVTLNSPDKLATIQDSPENQATFAMNAESLDPQSVSAFSNTLLVAKASSPKESPILAKIDTSISATSRSKEEVFVTLDENYTLTSLFE